MMYKVYKVEPLSSYSGGCALIAAESKENAEFLLDIDISSIDMEPKYYLEYVHVTAPELVENLYYNTGEPQVFLNTLYEE